MVESLDELTYDYDDEDGTRVRKQLDRVILASGGWASVMFLFEELDRKTGRMKAPKMALVRLRKSHGLYRKHSSFTISSRAEVQRLAAVFARWSDLVGSAAETEEDDPEGDDFGRDDDEDRRHEVDPPAEFPSR